MRSARTVLRAGFACALASALAALVWQAPTRAERAGSEPQLARTVVLVRHAEKDPAGDPRDPDLSEAGRARAAALARTLSKAGVTHLYATEFRRTQQTLAPLAEKAGVKVEVVPAASADAWKQALDAAPPGSVSVVAGHSNTVPALAAALGGTLKGLVDGRSGRTLGDDEYDRLIVITRPGGGGPSATLELTYGP